MFQATGWGRQAALQDVVLSGTIMRHFPDASTSSAPLTIKLRGDAQYDYLENGSVHLVVNGTAGALVDQDGKAHRIPAQSALTVGTLILPMSSSVLDWDAPDVAITFVGESSIDGEPCIGVEIARKRADKDPFAATRKNADSLTLWISTARSLPLRADYYRLAADNHTAKLRETVLFSDYRNLHGIALPFHQDISISGQLTYTYQFSDVQFNRGLADSDFDLARAAGGAQ
jgi:hypothetical protein